MENPVRHIVSTSLTKWLTLICLAITCRCTHAETTPPSTTSDEPGDTLGGYYLITLPKVLVAGSNENVLVTIYEPSEPLNVWISLSTNGETIAEASSVVTDEAQYTLEVPEMEDCTTRRASLTVNLKRKTAISWTVTEERQLNIQCNNRETFVQTDKAIYKPGQTVYFRILSLDKNFLPDHRPIESIWIEAPNQVRVAQWNDQDRQETGLIDLSFQMTSDPILGTWTIKALFRGILTPQEFSVEEYVLPRFEVTISVRPYVLITDELLPVRVCGIYSYGKPVQGKVTISVTVRDKPGMFIFRVTRDPDADPDTPDEETHQLEFDTSEDGCVDAEIDLADFEIQSRNSFNVYNQLLHVAAELTETASDISITAEGKEIEVITRPREMTWLSEGNFKPGLPYFARLKVEFPDGTPASNTRVQASCTHGDQTIYNSSCRTDLEGFASFVFDTPPGTKDGSIQCSTAFPDFPLTYQYDPAVYTLEPFHRSLYLEAIYSPTASYMQFKPVLGELAVGEVANMKLQYVLNDSDSQQPPDLKIQVLGRGDVIDVSVETTEGPSRIDTADGNYYYEISLTLVPISRMSPVASIVVFFIRDDLEVITASLKFGVKHTFKNKVDIAFEDEEVTPGESTNLNINSDPGSLCAVGIVDRSVVLLGGDNRITDSKVFDSVEKYLLSSEGGYLDGPPSCVDDDDDYYNYLDFVRPLPIVDEPEPLGPRLVQAQEAINRKKRQLDYLYRGFSPSYPKYKDASKAFVDSGLIYISNLFIETSPCNQIFFRAQPQVAFAEAALQDNFVLEDGTTESTQTVRTYFPETWLWDLYPVGASGSASIVVQSPDTITEWVGGGFCLNKDTGIGISEQVTIRAFQAFFIDLNLPYSVIRGEEIPINLSVFSYLTECVVVEVTLREDARFALLLKDNVKRVCACNGAVGVQFYIQPLLLGNAPIQVDAVSVASVDSDRELCGEAAISSNVGTRDSIRRGLLVEAEGVEEELTHTSYLCPDDYESGVFLDTVTLSLPDNYVPDSASGKITVIGDLLGPTLSNLDRLIRIPSGCGEQNMLGLVPNIYVLLYLTNTEQHNVELESKARQNIQIGYQKQLNYRLTDGSYSAFGNSDGEGSAWLTAFVVRSFAQAQDFVSIDESDLLVSVQWLRSLQNTSSGCFRSSGRVIHKGMQGGVNDEITLTAYILLAIFETGVDLQDETIVGGMRCLEEKIEEITDNYAIALVTYSLVKLNSTRGRDIFQKLEDAAVTDEGLVHWESNRADIPSFEDYYRIHSPAIQVEITAYALLSYLAYHQLSDAISYSSPIVKWLIQQQNPYGGFSSTQDTVVGLQALAEYAALVYIGGVDIRAHIVASPPCDFYHIAVTTENKLVLQEQAIPVIPALIQIAATGSGCAISKVSWKYSVFPEARNDAPFALNYSVTPIENEVSKYHLTICASYTGDDGTSNMALVENKPQSGFAPIEDSLDGLITKNLKQVDLEEGRVIVYFQELTSHGDCVSYDVEKVFDVRLAREGVLTVFDYYEKDLITSELYYIEPPETASEPLEGCPLCSPQLTENFAKLICSSNFVYKAFVGTKGNLQLHKDIKGDRARPDSVPAYLSLEFPEGCGCDLIKSGNSVLLMDSGESLRRADKTKPNLGHLTLESSSAVFSWSFEARRAALSALSKCQSVNTEGIVP